MNFLFYRWDGGVTPDAALPAGVTVEIWRPAVDGLPGGERPSADNLLWWAFDRAGLFASHDFAELRLVQDGRTLHRLIVTPRWHRFPDMAPGDLQLGGLWTGPAARGQGLASAAIAAVHARFAGRFARLWYIVAADNRASTRLIERLGYRLVGEGVRTRPLGIGAIGQFKVQRWS